MACCQILARSGPVFTQHPFCDNILKEWHATSHPYPVFHHSSDSVLTPYDNCHSLPISFIYFGLYLNSLHSFLTIPIVCCVSFDCHSFLVSSASFQLSLYLPLHLTHHRLWPRLLIKWRSHEMLQCHWGLYLQAMWPVFAVQVKRFRPCEVSKITKPLAQPLIIRQRIVSKKMMPTKKRLLSKQKGVKIISAGMTKLQRRLNWIPLRPSLLKLKAWLMWPNCGRQRGAPNF